MRITKENFKINELSDRASKSYEIKEVYKKQSFFNNVLNFIESQNLLPINNINVILNLSTDDKYPIGTVLIEKNSQKIVGFVGTFFSNRYSSSDEILFCNIHSWIVDKKHRLYSFYLISNLLNRNINLTAFTPVVPLKFCKLGFIKTFIEEKFYLNFNLFSFTKKKIEILETKTENFKDLSKHTEKISSQFSNKIFTKIIIKNELSEKLFILGILSKKKFFKVFKILYVSNTDIFKKFSNNILNVISKTYKVHFFSEYIIENDQKKITGKSVLGFEKKRDIYNRSTLEIGPYEIINSDLALIY